jgi:hypothetical protein
MHSEEFHSQGEPYGDNSMVAMTRKPDNFHCRTKVDPPWKAHDAKAQKSGQRSTIMWVGKAIVGEDGQPTGQRTKGASYHGEWDRNKKNGYGVQVFPNGEKYEGQWLDDMRNGEGTLWVKIGKANNKLRKLYVGGWKDDRRHGRGTCFFNNGEFYQGSWDHGKMHGHGTLRYSNGDLYIGEWNNGLRSSQGTLNKANGDCYEGYWLEDKREGSGSYFYAESGKVFVGEWAADIPKAGIYTQATPNPQQATPVPQTSVLPPVRLALPAEVLEGALTVVRKQRGPFRAQNAPLDRIFSQEERESLRSAFMSVEKLNGGVVRTGDIGDLCSHLGTEVSPQRLKRLLEDALGPRWSSTDDWEASFAFEDFLRVVALLLDEEAELHGEPSVDAWDETGVMNSQEFPSM